MFTDNFCFFVGFWVCSRAAVGRRSIVLVVFIGGVTFAEISALRFLSSQVCGLRYAIYQRTQWQSHSCYSIKIGCGKSCVMYSLFSFFMGVLEGGLSVEIIENWKCPLHVLYDAILLTCCVARDSFCQHFSLCSKKLLLPSFCPHNGAFSPFALLFLLYSSIWSNSPTVCSQCLAILYGLYSCMFPTFCRFQWLDGHVVWCIPSRNFGGIAGDPHLKGHINNLMQIDTFCW